MLVPLGIFWQDFFKTNSTVSETFIFHGFVAFAPRMGVYIDGGTWGPSQSPAIDIYPHPRRKHNKTMKNERFRNRRVGLKKNLAKKFQVEPAFRTERKKSFFLVLFSVSGVPGS